MQRENKQNIETFNKGERYQWDKKHPDIREDIGYNIIKIK